MNETTKLKAPKGTNAISVLGQEYKVVKGYVTVAIEHVADLVGFGFKGADGEDMDEQEVDQNLPAGVKSNLIHVDAAGPTADELAAVERAAADEAEAVAKAAKDEEEKRVAEEAEAARAEAEAKAAKDAAAAGPAAPVLE